MKRKIKIRRSTIERATYMMIVIGLVIYGLKESEVSVKLIHALMEAFSILFK